MFNQNFHKRLEEVLSKKLSTSILISSINAVSGGSINEAFSLYTDEGNFFIKTNSANHYPKMFEKEAKGLELLQGTNAIRIPKIIDCGEIKETSFLILEYINSDQPNAQFWLDFGSQLAKLHQHTDTTFGLNHSNYIGSLQQHNNSHNSWTDFFIQERLHVQIKLARDKSQIDIATISRFEKLYTRLDEIFPQEQPALLHGDLWSGNFMVDENGGPVIMDPAVYYGHREMDIAMTKLFGGFSSQFYDAYNNFFPLENGWENRMDICNLYPLMVHVNLFGGGYLSQVKKVLSKF
jgi:fructosamine-3-kinase